MRSSAGIWVLGGTASLALNLGVAAALMAAMQPQPIADQPVPESRLNVEAQAVRRSEATAQEPQSQTATEGAAKGVKLDNGTVAQSQAKAQAAPSTSLHAQEPQTAPAEVLQTPLPMLSAAQPAVPLTPAKNPISQIADAVQPIAFKTNSAPIEVTKTPINAPPVSTTLPQSPEISPLASSAPVLLAGLPQTPDSMPASQQPPANITVLQQAPDVTTTKAMLAFPTAGPVDPVSFAAFQSFMQPRAASGADLRDSLGAALSLPCARMQVTFDPETTTLNVTGHVPDASQRAPVLAALQAQMGSDIAVAENLLVLPAPQCGALTGIADVGLPQSTDQITNPLIVGADTHARAFRYVAGDPLVMSLTAPDYPAYVYVDYFDADGNVIHLSPNDRAPLQAVQPKSALQIGAENADAPGLFVTIGPPYGQEIAAAFAASAPLYEGTRPLVEPAGAYLEWLKEKVAAARTEHADFKGEWVYFFVTTAAN